MPPHTRAADSHPDCPGGGRRGRPNNDGDTETVTQTMTTTTTRWDPGQGTTIQSAPASPSVPATANGPWWRWARFRRDERGVTAIEFAAIAPLFFAFLFAIMEVSFWFIGTQVLESAVEQVGRKARTGEMVDMSQQDVINEICSKTASLLPDCENKLIVRVQPFSSFGTSSFSDNTDADGNLDPNATSSVTSCPANSVCVVEAEFEWDLLFNIPSRFGYVPGTSTEMRGIEINSGGSNGKTILKATMVFRAEPYV